MVSNLPLISNSLHTELLQNFKAIWMSVVQMTSHNSSHGVVFQLQETQLSGPEAEVKVHRGPCCLKGNAL